MNGEDKAKAMVVADLKVFYTDFTKLSFTAVDGSVDPNIWYMRGTFLSELRGARRFTYELNIETGEIAYRAIGPLVRER